MGRMMENFVLPRMPECGSYINIHYMPSIHNPEVRGRFYGLDLKGFGPQEISTILDTLDSAIF